MPPKPETIEEQTAKAVDPATPLFAILGRRLYASITSHVADGECDEWCEDVMEMATEIGLAKREQYDPEIHGSIDAEPGVSTIWTWRHLSGGWKTEKPAVEFIAPATGAEQLDLSQRGVLIIHDSAAVANSDYPEQLST